MSQKYDCVVTNPPYMGSSGFSSLLTDYVKKEYPASKNDMSTIFIEKSKKLSKVTNVNSFLFCNNFADSWNPRIIVLSP